MNETQRFILQVKPTLRMEIQSGHCKTVSDAARYLLQCEMYADRLANCEW